MKRRKPKAERKETAIHLRLTEQDKARITAAAKASKLEASAWLRSIALRLADELLGRTDAE